ncbi:MAG TPA: hypothetical protein VF272_02270 [Candidatus Saccharimonadia bacterium]
MAYEATSPAPGNEVSTPRATAGQPAHTVSSTNQMAQPEIPTGALLISVGAVLVLSILILYFMVRKARSG